MNITVGITVPDNMSLAEAEERLVHGLIADNEHVMSAVILRNTIPPHPLGWQRYVADEDTRQSR